MHWNFPVTITKGFTANVVVEFTHGDGDAWVDYEFVGAAKNARIGAQSNHSAPDGHDPNLYVEMNDRHIELGFKDWITLLFDHAISNNPKRFASIRISHHSE